MKKNILILLAVLFVASCNKDIQTNALKNTNWECGKMILQFTSNKDVIITDTGRSTTFGYLKGEGTYSVSDSKVTFHDLALDAGYFSRDRSQFDYGEINGDLMKVTYQYDFSNDGIHHTTTKTLFFEKK